MARSGGPDRSIRSGPLFEILTVGKINKTVHRLKVYLSFLMFIIFSSGKRQSIEESEIIIDYGGAVMRETLFSGRAL